MYKIYLYFPFDVDNIYPTLEKSYDIYPICFTPRYVYFAKVSSNTRIPLSPRGSRDIAYRLHTKKKIKIRIFLPGISLKPNHFDVGGRALTFILGIVNL